MTGFAEVRFKSTRRDYYQFEDLALAPGDRVIVEADNGIDLGQVAALGSVAQRKCSSRECATETPSRRVVRRATSEEVRRAGQAAADEDRARAATRVHVERHGLKMKVTDAEWQFDKKKLIVYFTADKRVDFRALVRDLARDFRTRIELKQIGVRDEAALLGGIGRCGRELCCSTWLPELKPVSLQVAKDQGLFLNPAQISGCCGRLMCCLMYEHDTYVSARRRFPRQGKLVTTARGREKVVGMNVFNETVTLLDEEGSRRVAALEDLKQAVAARRREMLAGGAHRQGGANGAPASEGGSDPESLRESD